MKILLAEPSRAVAAALDGLLKASGHSSEVVYDGVQALDRLSNERYDLFITETELPRINGGELLGRFAMSGIEIPTIGLLSGPSFLLREEKGMEALIPKPFRGEDLLYVIELTEKEGKDDSRPDLPLAQRILWRALTQSEGPVGAAALSALLPERIFGDMISLVRETNRSLSGKERKKIVSVKENRGYKVVDL